MKTSRFQLLHCIMLFATLISTIYCIGCADINDILKSISEPPEEDGVSIADMPIGEIEVLLAESHPVQVTIEVNGWLPDSCTTHHETHLTQEGNTITIQITTIRPKGFACATVATEYQERVSIGTLPAGDYIVIVNNVEQEFRIEEPPDGGGVNIANMPIAGIEVLLAESHPVQVTVEVNGWLPDSCTAHHETHLTQEGNTITIQITTARPKDFACATVATEYQERVSIGTLPAGDYIVIVNDVEQELRVD